MEEYTCINCNYYNDNCIVSPLKFYSSVLWDCFHLCIIDQMYFDNEEELILTRYLNEWECSICYVLKAVSVSILCNICVTDDPKMLTLVISIMINRICFPLVNTQ